MSQEFWGLPIEFEKGEKVIIDSAEVIGIVTDIQLNTSYIDGHKVFYCVEFPHGSVWTKNQGYDADNKWISQHRLRKIKPKKPSFFPNFFKGLLYHFTRKQPHLHDYQKAIIDRLKSEGKASTVL